VEFKGIKKVMQRRAWIVDIETEWNLKKAKVVAAVKMLKGRYRNRVEFKVYWGV